MAVKKKQTVDEVKVDEVEVKTDAEETKEDVADTDEVSVEIPEEKEETDGIEVDPEALVVDEVKIPEEKDKKVKIRLRVDHHCSIAMVRYDFKAGKVYDVPVNVKLILDNAGLLAPL